MTTLHRCDRCKVEADVFNRHLDISSNPVAMMDPGELDLCGYCWSKFIEWLKTSYPETP